MQHPHHQLVFAAMSLAVAVLGSWTALDLFRRVRSHVGGAQRVWLYTAAMAMGLSIWSMHFIAMLGFDPGVPVSYDPGLTLLSLILAIAATLGAFLAASPAQAPRRRIITAGFAMGGGICLMHYVGMAAVRSAATLTYDRAYVGASLIIAVSAATAALYAARRERSIGWRVLAAIILGIAIAGMHYTAMAGLNIAPFAAPPEAAGAPPLVLGVGVAAGSLLILVLALLAALYDERVNVMGALEAGGVGYFELQIPDNRLLLSARGKAILGGGMDAAFSFDDALAALAPEDRAKRNRLVAEAIATGGDYDAEYRVITAAGEERWINARGKPVKDPSGRVRRIVGVVVDITDRRKALSDVVEAERRQRVLIDELNHRVKNTLATVQSLARQTAKGAVSIDAFRSAFEARLIALSQTHDALTRGGWETAMLRELLEQEFAPHAAEQIELSGPPVILTSRQTLGLGMVFHELATNAAKYGALSRTNGKVRVAWGVDDAGLTVDWTERGGPPASAPKRTGFGSKLIKSTIEGELSGTIEIDYSEGGLSALIRAPLETRAKRPTTSRP